jgi:hypothetical protein
LYAVETTLMRENPKTMPGVHVGAARQQDVGLSRTDGAAAQFDRVGRAVHPHDRT